MQEMRARRPALPARALPSGRRKARYLEVPPPRLHLDVHGVQAVLGLVGQVGLLCPRVPHEDLRREIPG